MFDHVAIQCIEPVAGGTFCDAALAPQGITRVRWNSGLPDPSVR